MSYYSLVIIEVVGLTTIEDILDTIRLIKEKLLIDTFVVQLILLVGRIDLVILQWRQIR